MKHLKNFLLVVLSLVVVAALTACKVTIPAIITNSTKAEQTTTEAKKQTTVEVQKTTKENKTTKSETKKSTVTTTTEAPEPFEVGVSYSGSVSGDFVYDQQNNIYKASITLGEWGNITITYDKSEDESITLWYDTCTVSGDVRSADSDGADWTTNLYHQGEAKAWYCCLAKGCDYEITFNPTENTLVIAVKVEEDVEGPQPTDETFEGADFVAKYNVASTEYATVYDSSFTNDIELGEYTIATDADGKIIFASRTSEGYGGPADGFYHDGNYSWTAGQVCGIFELSDEFAAWTQENKDDKPSPWLLYSVKCPQGFHIITGSKSAMAKLIKLVADVESFDPSGNNSLFENETVKGSLNNLVFAYTTGTCCVGIAIDEVVVPTELVVSTDATAITAMTKDEESGVYTGVYKFVGWNSISFVYGDVVWYDNTTISGDITAVDNDGCPWTNALFQETESGKKWFHYGERAADYYKFVYDPAQNTLVVTQFVPGVSVETAGEVVSAFAENEGVWTGSYKLSGWNSIVISYSDENGNKKVVWYDNTTVTGDVTAVDSFGSPWNECLFHEESEGKKWIHSEGAGAVTYTFVYDPAQNTLSIATEAVETFENAKLVAKKNVTESKYVRVYDSTFEGKIQLGEYTIATNANGRIIFASRTSGSYGGPADGFYHDGNYSWTAGQVCGIFKLDANFAAWSDQNKNDNPGPWTLYSIVCPEGYHIITGSQANMAEFVKFLTGAAEFNEEGNALFENTVADGTLNKFKVSFVNGTLFAGIKVEVNSIEVTTTGEEVIPFAVQQDGTYVGAYTISGWDSISLVYDGTTIWYDNTTISGDVTASDVEGCPWTDDIYHDGPDKKWFHYGDREADTYIFVYNPANNTLKVMTMAVTTSATPVSAMTLQQNGTYVGAYTISGWDSISFTFGNVAIWYDNTTISGDITADGNDGCPWTDDLFQETASGKKWFHYGDRAADTYIFVYNPANNTLKVMTMAVTTSATPVSAMTLQNDGTYIGVYTISGWDSISFTFGNVAIWYDNTTISGDITADGNDGCTWSDDLFQEAASGKKWLHNGDRAADTYIFVYNPTNNTLKVMTMAVTTDATPISAMALQSNGTYVGAYSFTGWNSISFVFGNVTLWYDSATVSGNVSAADKDGCPWTEDLYHEGADKKWFHDGNRSTDLYKFEYNPTTNTLVVTQFIPGLSAEGGTAVSAFSEADGTWTGTYTLSGWNNIVLNYCDANGNKKVVWYDNTTVSGDVTAADAFGCPWTTQLFHEVADGKKWIHNGDGADTTYTFTYVPANNTLTIAVVTE